MNFVKFINAVLVVYYSQEEKILKDNFLERKIYTKTEIIKNDNIGCSEDFKEFNKQLMMSRYNINYDQVKFECYSVIDNFGVRYTKKYYEIKL